MFPYCFEEFTRESWEQSPLWMQRSNPAFLDGLLTLEDLDHYVSSTALDEAALRVARYDGLVVGDYLQESKSSRHRLIDPEAVLDSFADGSTLIFNALDIFHEPLGTFCRSLESAFCCSVQANVYLSPPGHQGFAPHFDTHDVFVLQVHGEKQWKLYGSSLELPLPKQRLASERRAFDKPETTIDLRCGDVLYIPRGHVHEGIAKRETSCHITLGFHTATVAALFQELLDDLASEEVTLRKSLPLSNAVDLGLSSPDVQTLQQIANRLFEENRLQACLDRLSDKHNTSRRVHQAKRLVSLSSVSELSVDSLVDIRPGLVFHFEHVGDSIRLCLADRDIEFPAHVETPLRALLRSGAKRIGSLPGDLDGPGKIVLVKRLVCEHVLTAVAANSGSPCSRSS